MVKKMGNIFEKILKYMQTAPVDVKGLIKELGISLKLKNLGNKDGYITKIDKTNYQIVINASYSNARQRFTMAHELAHYVLHRNDIQNGESKYRLKSHEDAYHENKENEIEANRFAASLLMPKDLVQKIYAENNNDVKATADALEVSAQALEIALKR